MPNVALFMNGIFQSVLEEILAAQSREPGRTFFLQPYTGTAIARLRDNVPSVERPVTFYASTSDSLSVVSYAAQVVGWEDKTTMTDLRRREVTEAIQEFQSRERGHDLDEAGLYNASTTPGKPSINLLHIRNLYKYDSPFSVANLIKESDGLPLSTNRTRSGRWSYVYELGNT